MEGPRSGTGDHGLPAVPSGDGTCVTSKRGEPCLRSLHLQEQLPEGLYWYSFTLLQTHAALIKQQVHELFNSFLPLVAKMCQN